MLNFEEEEYDVGGESTAATESDKAAHGGVGGSAAEGKENEDPTLMVPPPGEGHGAPSVPLLPKRPAPPSSAVEQPTKKSQESTSKTHSMNRPAAAAKAAVAGTSSVKSSSSSSGNSSVRSRVSAATVEGPKRGAKKVTTNQRSAAAPPPSPAAPPPGKGANPVKNAAAQSRKKADASSSPKVQRISLVARQSFAAAANKANKVNKGGANNPVLTRSATTANISRTATAKSAWNPRPLRAAAQPTAAAAAVQQQPKPPVTKRSSLPPFGSSSSISSSGSSRSWADTVKGLKAPRSVEDLTKNSKTATGAAAAAPGGSESSKATSAAAVNNEDEEGWETVRPRARSKYSPVSESSGKRPPPRVRHSNKTRFQMPSSAISLPTLAFMKEEENASEGSCDRSGSPPDKPGRGGPGEKGAAFNGEGDKTDAVKVESNSGDIDAVTDKTDEEEEEEEEDDDEASTDSAIAKLEEGIAMSQLEEDALIKAIRETEQGWRGYPIQLSFNIYVFCQTFAYANCSSKRLLGTSTKSVAEAEALRKLRYQLKQGGI